MRATSTARNHFSASHIVDGHSVCGKLHGHRWAVDVTVEGQISPKTGYVVDHGELAEALQSVVDELDRRDLNAMLPGVVPVPEGVAGYIRERLLFWFPSITSVMVRADSYEATLEWPLR